MFWTENVSKVYLESLDFRISIYVWDRSFFCSEIKDSFEIKVGGIICISIEDLNPD